MAVDDVHTELHHMPTHATTTKPTPNIDHRDPVDDTDARVWL